MVFLVTSNFSLTFFQISAVYMRSAMRMAQAVERALKATMLVVVVGNGIPGQIQLAGSRIIWVIPSLWVSVKDCQFEGFSNWLRSNDENLLLNHYI